MHAAYSGSTVNELFFQPLDQALAAAATQRPCPEFPDADWIRMGVQRVLEASESGRGFLQEHGLRFENTPGTDNYFASLRSERRRDLAREVNSRLIGLVDAKVCDRLASIPELARYACFVADGHWAQSGGA